jgi:hypothetical protein
MCRLPSSFERILPTACRSSSMRSDRGAPARAEESNVGVPPALSGPCLPVESAGRQKSLHGQIMPLLSFVSRFVGPADCVHNCECGAERAHIIRAPHVQDEGERA